MRNNNGMKSLILSITLFILTACGGGGGGPAQLPPAPPEQPPADTERIVFVYDPASGEIGTSDGTYFYHLATGKAANARYGFISINDILTGVDATGTVIAENMLPISPDAIVIHGADIWCFENIDPQTASTSGGTFAWYTKIYKNNSEYSPWWLNKWKTVDAFVTASGDIVAMDDYLQRHIMGQPGLQTWYAGDESIIIHSINETTMRGYIRDSTGDHYISFARNYFYSAKQWLKSGNTFYSWNGYSWDGITLKEQATALKSFTVPAVELPVVVAAGTRIEYGEQVLYWIECNTGLLYRYIPSLDRLEQVSRLYEGSGIRADGVNIAYDILPIIAGDYLFFSVDGVNWKYDFASGGVVNFASGVRIWRM